ncbi:hypothetical protein ASPZODRAFT_17152 [Penicilliopsis zonata CBS 506.65]|uniref:Uncharacterized protein n=1 Tax=Penicilliopsis zonata CBS 506.65 TaxID=1073090 RepID=A0A1L9SEL9_9EURO|nr:hypothetical protein ASPZODRAFT_17152 [Penicilliopsis zonata CBS 506.65]OJJ45705.1 hypothetical protein ASPZODRAFT_17152 [Penicilliopsis zonata CBS 506.65]
MANPSEPTPLAGTNRLITYLRTLATSKRSLPHGQLVCVCASHTISTTDALLELAESIGPHIAILQVQADIIDDWNEETGRRLMVLAKRYAFLIWEGGRILNASVDVVGKQSNESNEVKKTVIDLIRKKYTKGVIKPASWAGIATAWASGVAVDNQEADMLIPSLKAAARETVADTVQTIRTEITAEQSDDYEDEPDNEITDVKFTVNHDLGSELVVNNDDYSINGDGLPLRKASTISLTQTITQHTEPSQGQESSDSFEEAAVFPIDDLPPPPLLARGLVLCLPSANDTSFTSEYRETCIAAARANQDFVIGFMSTEPWDIASQRNGLESSPASFNGKGRNGRRRPEDLDESSYFALFSLVPHRYDTFQPSNGRWDLLEDDETVNDDISTEPLSPSNTSFNPHAAKLHSIIGQALKCRDAQSSDHTQVDSCEDLKIIHVPVISLP